jgi:NAD+ synthase
MSTGSADVLPLEHPGDRGVLSLDYGKEANRIATWMVEMLSGRLRRRGLVVAMSGGIDSSVCAALAERAVGPGKVLGLLLPERESSDRSRDLATELARHLGIEAVVEDISETLAAIGCYRWRDQAIRSVFPDYGPGWASKVVISGGLSGGFNFFKLVVRAPDGRTLENVLPHKAYLQIVAAQNHKQRIRKTVEYFHADRLHYAVLGTPNLLEYDQGFFVKNGDGAADLKPIAHLYKSQVYGMARHLGLPERICGTTPTTDTYSFPQGQDEFFFALPYQQMDLALWAHDHDLPSKELAALLHVGRQQAQLVYRDIESKRTAARYLHQPPMVVPAREA